MQARRIIGIIAAAAVLGGSAAEAEVRAAPSQGAARIAVVYRDVPGDARTALQEARGRRVVHRFSRVPAAALEVPAGEVAAVLEELSADPAVVAAAVETRSQHISAQVVPWGVKRVRARAVHNAGNTGAGIKVAVLDTGIDFRHPDLAGPYAGGYNLVDNPAGYWAPLDEHGHGTHVSGILAAADNDQGVVGVAPGVALYAVKVLDEFGFGYPSDFAAGVDWSIDNGMRVINYSAGGDEDPAGIMKAACQRAREAGVMVVASAGNLPGSPMDLPAAYGTVLAVGATDASNLLADFSETGPELDFVAPGVDILSTRLDGGYYADSGTSMAAPHVAGALALLLANGVTDPDEAVSLLAFRARDLGDAGPDDDFGLGLVNCRSALLAHGYVTSPAGGERISTGSSFPVTWTVPDGAAGFDVFLSTDGGTTWEALTTAPVPGPVYDWQVAPTRLNRGRSMLRVVAYDADGKLAGMDETPRFAVRVIDLDAPAPGEEVPGGLPYDIRWSTHETIATAVTTILRYSRDGVTWKPLTVVGGDPGALTWTPPSVNRPRRTFRVRVILKDESGRKVGKVTSQAFTVIP